MKKIAALFFAALFLACFTFPQESDAPGIETSDSETPASRTVVIPAKKRPKPADAELARKAALKDDEKNSVEKKQDTIKYGIASEITSLIKDLISNEDPRFSEPLYDLFFSTKSVAVREILIEYFTKFSDPCIEDYAVEILQDPYDTKNSTVSLLFRYVAEVKTKEAVPRVMRLLESDDETYFAEALSALGEIGGENEAVALVSYLDRDDLTVSQRQNLMKVLGKLNAQSTWDKLSEICQDEEENSFVRMYAAEAIGQMKKPESVPILTELFESTDPNLRVYVIKGLSNYDTPEAKNVIIQGIKDAHWKVRQEALLAAEKMKLSEAVPYIIYRAKNDPENVIKEKSYEVLAKLNDSASREFLISQVTGEKVTDAAKGKACEALLRYADAGQSEIRDIALSLASDDKRKPFRYTIGKLIAKYPSEQFESVCRAYLSSSDAQTCGLGLDMYASGKYAGAKSKVEEIADSKKTDANSKRAKKILNRDE